MATVTAMVDFLRCIRARFHFGYDIYLTVIVNNFLIIRTMSRFETGACVHMARPGLLIQEA